MKITRRQIRKIIREYYEDMLAKGHVDGSGWSGTLEDLASVQSRTWGHGEVVDPKGWHKDVKAAGRWTQGTANKGPTKKLNEGTLFVARGNYGYIGLEDDAGEDYSLGEVIAQLIDAGINNIFTGHAAVDGVDEVAFDRMLQQDAGKVQGGMEHWESDVFSEYYNIDPDRVIDEWAAMKGLEVKVVQLDDSGEMLTGDEYPEQTQASREAAWEDDGEYDFESEYS